MRKLLLLALLSAQLPVLATTITDNPMVTDGTYYRRGAEGWYWYQDPVTPEEEKPEAPIAPPASSSESKAPPVLSAAWVRKMIPLYLDKAWDNPTSENVEAFFVLQRYAMDRSQEFANVAQRVVTGNPYIDETYRRPISNFGLPAVDRQAGENIDRILKKVTEKAGIFFFFQRGCSYCETQAPIVKMLENFGFDVFAISIGGGELDTVKFKKTLVDEGQAAFLQVQVTPTMFLVAPNGQYQAIGSGLVSLEDMKRRILVVAARQGWLSAQEIEETRPILNPGDDEHNLSKKMPKMLQASNTKADTEGYIDPSILLAFLSDQRTSGVIPNVQY